MWEKNSFRWIVVENNLNSLWLGNQKRFDGREGFDFAFYFKVIMRIKESRHEAESYYVIVRSARSGLSLLRYVWGPFKIDEISSELLVRPDGKR